MTLETVTITCGNITYTHTGTPEAIKHAIAKMKKRAQIKLTEQEQREVMRREGDYSIATKETLSWVWKVYRQARIDKTTNDMLRKICNKLGCARHKARQLVNRVRRVHAIEIRTKKPDAWSE